MSKNDKMDEALKLYDQVEKSDPIAQMAAYQARIRGHLVVSVIGVAIMLGNYFRPGASSDVPPALWLALASSFVVLFVFDAVKLVRSFQASLALGYELLRLREAGAKDPMDVFTLLGGLEGWKQRLEAEEAAVQRAKDRSDDDDNNSVGYQPGR